MILFIRSDYVLIHIVVNIYFGELKKKGLMAMIMIKCYISRTLLFSVFRNSKQSIIRVILPMWINSFYPYALRSHTSLTKSIMLMPINLRPFFIFLCVRHCKDNHFSKERPRSVLLNTMIVKRQVIRMKPQRRKLLKLRTFLP